MDRADSWPQKKKKEEESAWVEPYSQGASSLGSKHYS